MKFPGNLKMFIYHFKVLHHDRENSNVPPLYVVQLGDKLLTMPQNMDQFLKKYV